MSQPSHKDECRSDLEAMQSLLAKLGAEHVFSWDLDPIGKPRMTQRDRWKKRPVVERYYAFKDALNLMAPKAVMDRLQDSDRLFAWIFHHQMPRSYSKKKKESLCGNAMKQKPDADNVVKAVWDSIYQEDKKVTFLWTFQCWSNNGEIELFEIPKSTIYPNEAK